MKVEPQLLLYPTTEVIARKRRISGSRSIYYPHFLAKLRAMLSGRHSFFHALRLSPRWPLAVATLAMALQTLAASGLWQAHAQEPTAGFHAEICTTTGLVSQPDGSSNSPAGTHDCCTVCALNVPLHANALPDAVPPAPTFQHLVTTDLAAAAPTALYLFPPSRAPPQV
jgi:hypothetical protein